MATSPTDRSKPLDIPLARRNKPLPPRPISNISSSTQDSSYSNIWSDDEDEVLDIRRTSDIESSSNQALEERDNPDDASVYSDDVPQESPPRRRIEISDPYYDEMDLPPPYSSPEPERLGGRFTPSPTPSASSVTSATIQSLKKIQSKLQLTRMALLNRRRNSEESTYGFTSAYTSTGGNNDYLTRKVSNVPSSPPSSLFSFRRSPSPPRVSASPPETSEFVFNREFDPKAHAIEVSRSRSPANSDQGWSRDLTAAQILPFGAGNVPVALRNVISLEEARQRDDIRRRPEGFEMDPKMRY
ncbi:hypothetical protein K474DRAFT_819661 [Panus rudis PR-1116 ss-1]|nr:hypothetical protein K474DRAFT_819661 [Panus rudis PR-1116 ss-1]